MDDTVYLTTYPELLGDKLGGGLFGHVYADKTDPSLCIKMSNKQNDINYCRQWSNEYKKIKELTEKIGENVLKKLKFVRIIKPTEFVESPSLCYMKMIRIVRTYYENDLERQKSSSITIQPQLGYKNLSIVHKTRGQYIGLRQIQTIFTQDELETACYELGILLGLIHYIGKNNALDTELFLGREYRSNKVKFYIADFDATSQFTNFDIKTIKELGASIGDIPYYPRSSVNKKLYKNFYEGYCSIVPIHLAELIFEEYKEL